jgi:acetyltransferase-like isoleucine patch superfamily enzyme
MMSTRAMLRPLYERLSLWLYRRLEYIKWLEEEKTLRALTDQIASYGPGLSLKGPIRLSGAEFLTIGANVHIGENAFIRAEGGLWIGDNTRISRNLVLYTISHRYDGQRLPYDEGWTKKPVTIGKNVWIGMNVTIAPGTTIGDGAVVGMGTTVSGTVPPLSIIGSEKWRQIGQRDADHYRVLEEAGSYGDPDGHAK